MNNNNHIKRMILLLVLFVTGLAGGLPLSAKADGNGGVSVGPRSVDEGRDDGTFLLSVRLTNRNGVSYVYYSSNTTYGEWYGEGSAYIPAGEQVYVGIGFNSGYKCKAVTLNGEAQTIEGDYMEFLMPSSDMEIIIDTQFDPSSPSDPQPGDEARKFKLTVVCNPSGAGSVDGSGVYAAGRMVEVSAYNNNGYKFLGWSADGETIGTDRYMSYTMPGHDTVLTANYVYDPSSPSDPEQERLKHPLTVTASPSGAGYFSYSDEKVTAGEEYYVYAYPNTGYRFKGWIVNGEAQEETSTNYRGIMTEAGAQVIGLFVFDPVSPGNPGANYFNAATGEAIIDDFSSGYLYDAFRKTIGSDNYDNVSSLIVKGLMSSEDYGTLSYLANAATIDLSRTGGTSNVPGYAFSDMGVSRILLPSTITEIGNYAFRNCENLTSITLYSLVPPTCAYYTFTGFTNKENCMVYVPREAIELYQNADQWKEFTILPIMTDAHVLQVNLPEDASDGRYKNNSIEIVNLRTDVRQKYVVSDRLVYTFNGLQKDEQYNVYMLSQSGFEIGRIENVVIPNDDIEVTFEDLKTLYTAVAKVLVPDGTDVTSQVSVEWLKPLEDGTITYLRKATSISEIPEGELLLCRIGLDSKLGTVHVNPEDVEFTVNSSDNNCIVNLVPFRTIGLSGVVVDGDGSALSGASVSASQMLNGKYSKTYTAKTDRKGKWSLNVLDAPETNLTFAASECVNVVDTIGAFGSDVASFDSGKTTMKSIVGARVSYGFTYHAAGEENVENYYPDYQNVAISVYNETQDRPHNEVSVQYPLLAVLDENINAGDILKLTATSKTGAFNPIVETVTIGEDQRAEVTFDIVGKGGITASFEMTENPAVTAMLYSDKGELVKKQSYSEAKSTFTGLEDGNYTLVSMGQSELMNSILRLSNFAEIGLTEGKDYIVNLIKVESGKLSEVKNSEIPTFDESVFYYTNSSTGFSANKSSITTGNYLTLRAAIDFKGVYKNDISNVALVVDLPEACDFVEQSVIQGPNLLPYTLDNNRLTIQLGDNYQNQTRFCVMPTAGGSFNASASIVFDCNGKSVRQPIGTAQSEIKDIEITVPSVIAGTAFKVSGVAIGNSQVNVYEDGTLLGSGKANAAGSWSVDCELTDPYNLSTHSIYAEITTPAENTLTSETKNMTYDINALQVSKVTMYHWNPEMNKTFESVFDFMNPKTSATQWTVYYPDKKFTYTIEFTDNDPERISNVILYVHTADGKFVPVNASFDEKKGLWFAAIDMGTSSNGYYPVNCSVDFDYVSESRADYRQVSDMMADYNTIKDNYLEVCEELNEYEDVHDIVQIYERNGLQFMATDYNTSEYDLYLDSLSDDSLLMLIDSEIDLRPDEDNLPDIENVLSGIDSFFIPLTEFSFEIEGDIVFESKSCDGITKESLIEQGFTSVSTTDNEELFFFNSDSQSIYVDFRLNQYIEITKKNTILFRAPDDGIPAILEWHNKIQSALNKVRDAYMELQEKIGCLNTLLDDEHDKYQGLVSKNNKKWQEYNELHKRTEAAIRNGNLTEKELATANATIAKCNRMKDHYNSEIKKSVKQLKLIPWAKKAVKTLVPTLEKIIPIAKYVDIAAEGFSIVQKFGNLYSQIPYDCECDANAPAQVRALTIMATGIVANILVVKLATESVMDLATAGQVVSSPLSGGASLGTAFATVLAKIVIGIALDCAYDKLKNDRIKEVTSAIAKLKEKCNKCKDPNDEDQKGNDGDNDWAGGNSNAGMYNSGTPNDNVSIDPSGFVFEAVAANRVEGVQATIYYKETKEDMYGDPYEEIILWNAEEYAQKNPLFTDENGMYRWDVPQGLWQVKFEKDGYATAYSEWLPVPPPQLEVNIGIVQNKQPEVTEARAYEDGVEVQFDKFMDLSTLNTSNICVTANGEKLNGEVTMVDSALADEYASEDDANATRYASRVRFVPEEKLSSTTGEIRLTVSRNVLSYAGIPMTETYSQTLDVEKEVKAIVADDVKVLYGGEKEVTISAIPYDAAVSRTLHIATSSDLIASIDKTEAVLDEEGKATITIKGDLPGRCQLAFSIDDVTETGDCVVDVVTEIITAEAPKSSRASGTAVYRGTKIELTTESKDATIYFTTDGSCPCDENGTRRKYTVPIVINEDTKILAMTSVGNGDDDVSETVEFNYTLKRSDMDFQLDEGWTWISHNLDSPIAPSDLSDDEGIRRVMSQTQEVIRDPELGLIGNLTSLSATGNYKVQTTAATSRKRLSDIAWNPSTPISIQSGWNWIGYPVAQTMTVDEAFAPTKAEMLDAVVGQTGFSQYDGENWIGTLETMSPGEGYMYFSQSDKNIVYNTSIVSKAAARNISGITSASPLVVDIHKYSSVMPVVASLRDAKGTALDNEDYAVAAFSGSECRGIGRIVKDIVMMNVYGEKGDPITFFVTDTDGETTYSNDVSLEFSKKVIGDIFNPYTITIGDSNGVAEVEYAGNVKVYFDEDILRIKGVAADDFRYVEVYDLQGQKLVHETKIGQEGIRIPTLSDGLYVVIVNGNGKYTYHKVAK